MLRISSQKEIKLLEFIFWVGSVASRGCFGAPAILSTTGIPSWRHWKQSCGSVDPVSRKLLEYTHVVSVTRRRVPFDIKIQKKWTELKWDTLKMNIYNRFQCKKAFCFYFVSDYCSTFKHCINILCESTMVTRQSWWVYLTTVRLVNCGKKQF